MNKIYLPASGMNDLETIIEESWEIRTHLKNLKLDERKIITLSGDHGMGKDTWAKLMEVQNPEIAIIRFADPLREAFAKAGIPESAIDSLKRTNFTFPNKIVDGYQLEGKTVREALIFVAESNKVKYGQDYYAKQAIAQAQKALDVSKLIVFTDLRFNIENQCLRDFAKANALFVERINIPEGLPKIEVI